MIGDIILSNTNAAFKNRGTAKARQKTLLKAGIHTELRHVGDDVEDTHVLVEIEKPGESGPNIEDPTPVSTLADLNFEDNNNSSDDDEKDNEERRPPRHKRERKRIPLGTQGPLYIAEKYKDPNYVERYVNNKPGRIDAFRNAGYEMVCVSKDNKVVGDPHCGKGTKVGTPVTLHAGDGELSYLMRIKREWYDEDQKKKQDKRLDIVKDLGDQPNKEGHYGKVELR